MNKSELIEQVISIAGDEKHTKNPVDLTRAQASAAMDALTTAIANALRTGDRVTLVGFGTFSVSDRAARTGRNPQTGETLNIAARKVPKFKAGKELSELINTPAKKKK